MESLFRHSTGLQYFVRSARLVLTQVYDALRVQSELGKAGDPDRQKGTL